MIAIRLKELRTESGLNQSDLCKQFNLSSARYSQYETGKRVPDYELLIKFADFYEVSIDYLLGRDRPKKMIKEKSLSPDRERLMYELSNIDDETAKELELIYNYLKSKKEQSATGTET